MFAMCTLTAEIVERHEVYVAAGHIDWAFINTAILREPSTSTRALESSVASAARYFSAGKNGWMFVLSDDWLAPEVQSAAPSLLEGYGLKPVMTTIGMVADRLLEPRRPMPLVDVRPVRNADERRAMADINAASYDVSQELVRKAFDHEHIYGPECMGFLGTRNGVPITSTLVTPIDGNNAYVGLVATLPDHQRIGAAEAVMRHALAEARRAWGVERTVLHATEEGSPVYLRMGYRPVTHFKMYMAAAPGTN
jgi:ribosomal protein S18 acetylase RimI-like enzyme